jgi:uncharacterized SAM-binding protein YcdF (DUF218 family)
MTSRRVLRWAQWACACIGAGWLLITFTPIVKYVAGKLAIDWYEGNGDVLVVLGGSMLVPGTGPQATIGYDTYLRTAYAAWMLKAFKFQTVIVSGGGGLAEGMAKFLNGQGVPASSILLEPRSQSTAENALYVKRLLQQQGIPIASSTIVIVTSDYHSFRARLLFKHYGIPVRVMPAPDVVKRAGSPPYRLEGFLTVAACFARMPSIQWTRSSADWS